MNLIYVADPMCSWCYGFGKTLSDLQDAPAEDEQFALMLVMGGLRPYTTQPMDAPAHSEYSFQPNQSIKVLSGCNAVLPDEHTARRAWPNLQCSGLFRADILPSGVRFQHRE